MAVAENLSPTALTTLTCHTTFLNFPISLMSTHYSDPKKLGLFQYGAQTHVTARWSSPADGSIMRAKSIANPG